MLNVKLTDVKGELERINNFILEQLAGEDKVVVGVSGGIDSDVIARLVVKAVGPKHMKFFTVIQEGMETRHLNNARELAGDLKVPLVELNMVDLPFTFMGAMIQADNTEEFRPKGLDASRVKCSLRTVINSTYQDHGYVAIGTSNRTEWEAGFFLPFGDGIAHIKPIIHLYKTQVRQIAQALGTRQAVLDQPASAGFWPGEEDLEDMAWWLYNEGPIGKEIDFDKAADEKVAEIHSFLTTERVDLALLGIYKGLDDKVISQESELPPDIIALFHKLTAAAKLRKQRPINSRLPNLS